MSTLTSILIYVSVFAASAFVVQYGYRRKSKVLQALGLLIPTTLAGLRYDVGLDYMSYFNAYADITNPLVTLRYDGTPDLEVTFKIIAHISHFISSSPIPLFFAYAAITVFAFYAALRIAQPRNVGYALFFFYSIFFLNSFNIMRQGAAMSIGALALMHYTKGHRRKTVIYILIAALFHISALLLVLYVAVEYLLEKQVLVRKKIKRFTRLFIKSLMLSAGLIFAGLSFATVGNYIYEITGRIGAFDTELSMGVIFKYLLTASCLYVTIYTWKDLSVGNKRLSLFVLIGMVIYSIGIIHNESARIGMYLIILAPILAAVTFSTLSLKNFKGKFFTSVGVTLLGTLYIASVHQSGEEEVRYRYQTVITSENYTHKIKEINS